MLKIIEKALSGCGQRDVVFSTLLVFSFLLNTSHCFADVVTNGPGGAANDATIGAIAWVNPSNCTTSDNNRASAALTRGGSGRPNSVSQYLKATNFNFNLPSTAVIEGIIATIERSAANANMIRDRSIRIVQGATIMGTEKAVTNFWPLTGAEATRTYGASNDLWGTTLTADNINDPSFGIVVAATNANTFNSTRIAYIDYITIVVYYRVPPSVNNNGGASNVTTSGAILNGQVFGWPSSPTAYIYWGPTDGGTNKSSWSNVIDVGVQTNFFTNAVSGLTSDQQYYYRCYASNATDDTWAPATTNFTTLSVPSVNNSSGASGITTNSAILNGNLTSTGGTPTQVYIYWGSSDGGTNKSSWTNQVSLGTLSTGLFSTNISGLALASQYYYRCYATNSAGGAWAASTASFTTLALPPVINNNGGATNITVNNATLRGVLTSTGGAPTTVIIYYGLSNGGTNASAWSQSLNLGVCSTGAVSTNASSLISDSPYYYTCFASNSSGWAWATPSSTFTTLVSSTVGWRSGYQFRKKITVSTNMVVGSANLAKFPFLISLTDPDLKTTANDGHVENAQGYDIIFTSLDGVGVLSHEVETYTATNGQLVGWVLIPSLKYTTNTVIYMYYGNNAVTSSQENASGVWPAPWKSVAHMNQPSSSDELDSVTGNMDYIKAGTGLTSIAGKIGFARNSTGGGDVDYLKNLVLQKNIYPHTYMMWVYVETLPSLAFSRLLSREPPAAAGLDWEIDQAAGYQLRPWWGAAMNSVSTISTGTWIFLATTFTNGTANIYFNGLLDVTGANTARADDGDLVLWRSGKGTGRAMTNNTVIDEFRVCEGALSQPYLRTTFNNQSDPSTYVTPGPECREFTWLGEYSTAWTNAMNWAGGQVPSSSNDVYFSVNSRNCALTSPSTCRKLTTAGFTNSLSIGTNNLALTGDLHHSGGTIQIGISAGTGLDVSGAISNSATIACSGASRIYCAGNWINNGTFTPDIGTVTFDGSSQLSGSAVSAFSNLTVSGTLTAPAGTMRVSGIFANSGTFSNNSGTIDFNGTSSITGTSSLVFNAITVSGTLSAPTGTISIAGNFVNNGTFSPGTGTINFNGNSTISGSSTSSFNNVIVSGTLTAPAATMRIAGAFTDNGTFNHASGTVLFNGNTAISGTSTSSFNNVTISDTLTASAGTVNIAGNFANNGTFNHNSGTLIFNGNSTISGTSTTTFNGISISGILTAPAGTVNVAGNFVNNGTLNHNSGTMIFNGNSTISGSAQSVFNNLIISGILTAHSGTMTVEGIFANEGTFNHNSGTVTFEGAAVSIISNSAAFYRLTCTQPGKNLMFDCTATQNVSILTLTGNSVSRIVLRSTVNNTRWGLNVLTSAGVSYVDVKDSNAQPGITIIASASTNSLNNTNWVFSTTYYYIGSNTDWNTAANWSFSSGGAGGAGIPGISDDVRFDSNSGNCTLDANASCLSINTAGFSNSITIGTYDLNAAQAITHAGGTISIDASAANGLSIGPGGLANTASLLCTGASKISCAGNWSNNGSFTPNTGTVTFNGVSEMSGVTNSFNNIAVTGTLTAPTGTVNIAGNFVNDGSFTHNSGTVLFNGNTAISGTSTSTFNTISISGTMTAPAGTMNIVSNMVNNGTFIHNSGTIDFGGSTAISGTSASGFNNITISGTLTAPAGTMNIAGNLVNNGTFINNSGTVVFNGNTSVGGSSVSGFKNVTVSGTLTAAAGLMNISGNLINSGTFNHNSGLVVFDGTSAISGTSTSSFNSITISGTLTAPAGTMNVASNFANNGTFIHNSGTVTFNGSSSAISGTSTSSFSTVAIYGTAIAPTGTMNVTSNFVNNGTFNHNSGTVVFNGASSISGTNAPSFNNLTITGMFTAPSGIMNVAGNFANNGTFIHNSGTVTFNGNSLISGTSTSSFNNISVSGILTAPAGTVNIAGNLINSGTFNHNSGTVIFNGNSTMSGTAITIFNNLLITGNLTAPAATLEIEGNYSNNGTFNHNNGNVVIGGAGTSLLSGNTVFNNLACTTPAKQLTFAAASTQTIAGIVTFAGADGNLVILRSSINGSQWYLSVSGTSSVSYVDVKDSNAGGGKTIVASASLNSLNNTNWLFSTAFYYVGGWTAYSSELLSNANFEAALGAEWTKTGAGSGALQRYATLGDIAAPQNGANFVAHASTTDNSSGCYQDINLSSYAAQIAAGNAQMRASGYLQASDHYYDDTRLRVIFYDSSSNEISASSYDSAWVLSGPDTWTQYGVDNYPIPTNAVRVRLWAQFSHPGLQAGAFDNATCKIRTKVVSDWDSSSCWSLTSGGAPGTGIPASTNDVIFDKNSGDCILDTNATCQSISTVGYIRSLNIGQYDMVISRNLTLAGGTINLGSSTNVGLNIDGNLDISGTLACSGTSLVSVAGNWVNDGTFIPAESIVTLDGTTEISGTSTTSFHDIIITGTLTAPAAMNVSGDWIDSTGSFIHNSGKVTFNGTNAQTVTTGGAWNPATTNNNWKNNWSEIITANPSTGGVTFLDGFKTMKFTCTTPASRLFFQYQQSVTNVFEITASDGLNLQGAAGQLIQLRRYGGSGSNRWEICPSTPGGLWTVSYVDVMDSINSATNAIFPASSTDSGNTVNWFVPTLVQVTGLKAQAYSNQVVVSWKTISEMNNAGFNVYRSLQPEGPYTRINSTLIPGLGNSIKGREYEFADIAADASIPYYYKLEAIEFSMAGSFHGPVMSQPAQPEGSKGSGESKGSGGPAIPPEAGNSGVYKIYVTENGIFRLTHTNLTAGGVTNLDAWTIGNTRMYNLGSEIPVSIHDEGDGYFGTNDYIEFFGTGLVSRFTDENVYWLYQSTNVGLRIPEISISGGTTATSVWNTTHYEENKLYWEALPDEAPDDDHWFFNTVIDAPGTTDIKPVLQNISGVTSSATVRIALRGINYNVDHHIQIEINGLPLPDGFWSGDAQYIYSAVFPQTNLVTGTNTITVTAPGDTGAPIEQLVINWTEIDCIQNLNAENSSLVVKPGIAETIALKVSGLAESECRIFCINSTTNLSVITNTVIEGTGPFSATFSASPDSNTILAVASPSGMKTPIRIDEASLVGLRNTTNGADYIIISHGIFIPSIQPLADYRSSQGLRTMIVDIQDIYNDFSFGIFNPYAIRDFLSYAREYWSKPAPTYVLLVGDGTYDYKDNEGSGVPTFIPAKFVHDTESWEAPSDNWYACLDGDNDLIPDMHIGRFPVQTTNDVAVMINKTITYEAADTEAAWTHNVMLIADDKDVRFENICSDAGNYLPQGYTSQHIFRRNYPSASETKADIINGINNGALLTLYSGHGSIDQWNDEPIFSTADINGLGNQSRLSVVVTPTCLNGHFAYPGWESLAEELLRATNGGAVACISPSGLSQPSHQSVLVNALFSSIFNDGAFQAGMATTHALRKTFNELGSSSRDIIQTSVFFGDPALGMKKWSGYSANLIPPSPFGNMTTYPPFVTGIWPRNNSTDATPDTEIRISFSEGMDAVSTVAALTISPAFGSAITWEDNVLLIKPQTNLASGVEYTVTIRGSARGLTARSLDGNDNGISEGSPIDDVVINFTPGRMKVEGTITYDGGQSGRIIVLAALSDESWSTDISTSIMTPGDYSLAVPLSTNIWIKAFIDSNGNGIHDTAEARSVYMLNPLNITTNTGSIDIDIFDTDSDSDGIPDWMETGTGIYRNPANTGTSPYNADTDGDGLTDYEELFIFETDPFKQDTDSDGLSDSTEVAGGSSPVDPFDPAINLLAPGNGGTLSGFTSEFSATFAATNLTDGTTNKFWSSASIPGAQQTFTYRFPASKAAVIHEVSLYNHYNEASPDGCRDFRLQVSSDGSNFTDVVTGTLLDQPGVQRFSIGNIETYSLRLVVTSGYNAGPWNLAELEVTGILKDREFQSDDDGMPDWWESAYGFDPLDSSDGMADSDSDGLKNYAEYLFGTDPTSANSDGDEMTDLQEKIAGTDPNDSSSIFKFSTDTDPAMNYTLSWNTLDGRWYTVQTNNNLVNSSGWVGIPGFIKVPGNGTLITFTNQPVSDLQIYYRIVVTDQP